MHWNGCGLILHELCHLIHNVVLPNGLDNVLVEEVYKQALDSGKYKKIIRRDWAGRDIDYDKAYALVNRMELFAEISVAYLSRNYSELDEKRMEMKECSPPLCSPHVVETVQRKLMRDPFMRREELQRLCGDSLKASKSRGMPLKILDTFAEIIMKLFCVLLPEKKEKRMPHCNKFYPFTRGQLKVHDPWLYSSFTEIWNIVTDWRDEWDEEWDGGRNCGMFAC